MNQYVAAGDTTYTYDANGNLISKISEAKLPPTSMMPKTG